MPKRKEKKDGANENPQKRKAHSTEARNEPVEKRSKERKREKERKVTTKQSKDHTSSYGKKIHRPKKIKPLRTQKPAFKKYKVVSNRRAHHPFVMFAKKQDQITGFKLTSKKSEERGRRVKMLKQNPNPNDRRKSYFQKRPEKAKPEWLWLPDKMRSWRINQNDKKRMKKELRKHKKRR